MRSATAMAIGVVTDLGASDNCVGTLAPNARAIPMADATAQTLPTLSPSSTGQRMARTLPSCAYSGIASATVAGPSKKCTNCAPAK